VISWFSSHYFSKTGHTLWCRYVKVRFDPSLSTEHLPTAQTCFLTLRMPIYASKSQLSERLLLAISYATSGFGFM
jgi:hypothetical protein